jgi:hypothetical protein
VQNLSIANRMSLFWVPGHSVIFGNDNADELTRQKMGLKPSATCEAFSIDPQSTSLKFITQANFGSSFARSEEMN